MYAEQLPPTQRQAKVSICIHHRHSSLLSPKADTHYRPRSVERWVDVGGWLHIETVYPPGSRSRPVRYE